MAGTLCSVFHVKQDQSDPFDTTVMALRQHYRVGQRRLNPIQTIGFIHGLIRKCNGMDVSGSNDEVCAAVGEQPYHRLHSKRVCAFSAIGGLGSPFNGPYRDVCPQGGRSGCSAGLVRRSRPFPNQIPKQRHAVRSRRASMAARALKWHEVAELRPTASRLV